jgi:hypothetical protein
VYIPGTTARIAEGGWFIFDFYDIMEAGICWSLSFVYLCVGVFVRLFVLASRQRWRAEQKVDGGCKLFIMERWTVCWKTQ